MFFGVRFDGGGTGPERVRGLGAQPVEPTAWFAGRQEQPAQKGAATCSRRRKKADFLGAGSRSTFSRRWLRGPPSHGGYFLNGLLGRCRWVGVAAAVTRRICGAAVPAAVSEPSRLGALAKPKPDARRDARGDPRRDDLATPLPPASRDRIWTVLAPEKSDFVKKFTKASCSAGRANIASPRYCFARP